MTQVMNARELAEHCIGIASGLRAMAPPQAHAASHIEIAAAEAIEALTALHTADREAVLVEAVWTALKERCCSDPENAKRCVMVSRDDLAAALTRYQGEE